jgi:hypothetical protein
MRNILSVFLASPSDLPEERERAVSVVNEINQSIKTLDWSIDLLGWEDTSPGYGRPQALINRDVQRCDLFVGLLWRRWGTPPANDTRYSSGFEEEYSIAKERREQNPSPEIWMFFKKVDPSQAADPGSQLQRVIAFRESLASGRAVLFKEFDSLDAWEKMLRTYLWRHVLSVVGPQSSAPEQPSLRIEPASEQLPAVQEKSTPAGYQIALMAESLKPSFEKGDISAIAAELGNDAEMAFLGVRMYLLSAALVETSGTSLTPLAVHELNTLYRYRRRLEPAPKERRMLFRTLVGDSSDTKPGWHFFGDEKEIMTVGRLIYIILFETDVDARRQAFQVLRVSRLSLFDSVKDEYTITALQNIPISLMDDAWAYLVDVIEPSDLSVLKPADPTAWFASRLQWLEDWTAADGDYDKFLASAPDPQLLTTPQKEHLLSTVEKLSEGSLNTIKVWPIHDLSRAAIKELERRGAAITEEDRLRLLENPQSLLLEAIAAKFAPSKSMETKSTETDEELYARLSNEDIAAMHSIDWYTLEDAFRYRILLERGLISRDLARKDITEAFQRVHRESDELRTRVFGEEQAAYMREKLAQYEQTIRDVYTQQVFMGLATNPTAEDVILARQFLQNQRVGSGPLRIVINSGDTSDVNRLIEIARSSFGEDRTLALEGVRRFASDAIGTAEALLSGPNDRELQRLAISLIRNATDQAGIPVLEELLSNEDELLRVAAVSELVSRLGREQLVCLLDGYINRQSYYYNVATWLDRLLYAPEPLHSYYQAEIHRKAKNLTTN